jgi:signal transduction histidine kinase
MSFAIVIGRNSLTGAIVSFPKSPLLDERTQDLVRKHLDQKPGEYRENGSRVGVIETANYKFSALMSGSILDQDQKIRQLDYSLRDLADFCESLDEFCQDGVREYVGFAHDVRYLIGTLVHKSIVNKRNEGNILELRENLAVINAVAGILSAKDTLFRFQTKSHSNIVSPIDVVGKCYKIFKAAKFLARNHRKEIQFTFDAVDRAFINTYEVFDFMPYILVENAIKYAPKSSDASLSVRDMKTSVLVEVESMGPVLEPGEPARVFERGFRGVNAIKAGLQGDGMGLYHIADALRRLDLGRATIRQIAEPFPLMIDGIPYARTILSLELRK